MRSIEQKIAKIINDHPTDTAAKLLYLVMSDCVSSERFMVEENVNRVIDLFLENALDAKV